MDSTKVIGKTNIIINMRFFFLYIWTKILCSQWLVVAGYQWFTLCYILSVFMFMNVFLNWKQLKFDDTLSSSRVFLTIWIITRQANDSVRYSKWKSVWPLTVERLLQSRLVQSGFRQVFGISNIWHCTTKSYFCSDNFHIDSSEWGQTINEWLGKWMKISPPMDKPHFLSFNETANALTHHYYHC